MNERSDKGWLAENHVSKNLPHSCEKPETWAWHLLGLINPLVVITGNVVGGIWSLAGAFFVLGLGPLFDVLFGQESHPRPPRQSGRPFECLLFAHAMLQLVAVGTLLYRACESGLSWPTLFAALSTGVQSGASGLVVAHELGHRRRGSLPWWIGRMNLLTVLYLHFTFEHNQTHHRYVATTADPATARLGESIWFFVARTVPGQFIDAWSVQSRKVKDVWHNPVAQGVFIELLLIGIVIRFCGDAGVIAFLVQAAVAIFLLEYINYIRHYGLRREIGERQTAAHSWQAEQRWSRWTLLELTRHSAHHLKASDPFWRLQPCEKSPRLPSGYYGCFWIALLPPLWRRIIHPRLPINAACRDSV